jgi:hypothetical protein
VILEDPVAFVGPSLKLEAMIFPRHVRSVAFLKTLVSPSVDDSPSTKCRKPEGSPTIEVKTNALGLHSLVLLIVQGKHLDLSIPDS